MRHGFADPPSTAAHRVLLIRRGRHSRLAALSFSLASLVLALAAWPGDAGSPGAPTQPRGTAAPASQARFVPPRMPIGFIANGGQMDPSVRYYSYGPSYGFFLTREEAVFGLAQQATNAPTGTGAPGRVLPVALGTPEPPMRHARLAVRFLGANPAVVLEGRGEDLGKVNYLIGSDPAKWRTGLSTYREVVYRELWPGVDLMFGNADGRLKSEFALRPGARVEAIRLAYRGAQGVTVDATGNLSIRTPVGVLTEARPTSYQEIAGRRVPVEARFALKGIKAREHVVGFVVGDDYDPNYPLIIDPSLAYSSYLGGAGTDRGFGIDTEPGKVYVTGTTSSSSFVDAAGQTLPSTPPGARGGGDAFVARLDVAGSGSVSLGYLTFIGGSASDSGLAIAVLNGEAYVTGQTFSSNFPVTPNAFRKTSGGGGKSDAFVLKLNASGTLLLYSTYFGGGGPDIGHALAVDSTGVYVVGETQSSNFPITPFSVFAKSQGKTDAFVSKFDTAQLPSALCPGSLCYSTYLGGNGDDIAWGVAADGSGNAYVAGQTASSGFPTTVAGLGGVVGAYDPGFNGNVDAFVAKLNVDGSKLLYSTFFGGTGFDAAYAIALDATNNVYITGETNSLTGSFPTTAGAYDTTFNGNVDAFVAKLNPDGLSPGPCPGTLCYSTFVGGGGADRGYGIVVDAAGAAYVTGETTSTGSSSFAGSGITATFGPRGGVDVFAAKLSTGGQSLLSTVFLGGSGLDRGLGIALDSVDTAYLTGETASSNFPTTTGAFAFGGGTDAFVTKLGFAVVNTKPTAEPKQVPAFEDTPVTFTVTATDAETADSTKLTYNVDTTTPGLAGTLSGAGPAFNFTPNPNSFGTTTFTYTVTDRGAPDNCGPPSTFCAAPLTSDPATVTITVAAVNDAPSFATSPNPNQVVSEDAGGQVVLGWVSSISPGAANESDQTLTFVVTTDNPGLFAVQPAINPATGALTYTLAPNANGLANVTVKLQDSGPPGSCGPGEDCNTSAEQTFTITVNAVNDPPVFDPIPDQTVVEAVSIAIAGVAPAEPPVPADEAGQSVTLTATSSVPTLVTNLVITGSGSTRTLSYERPASTQDQSGPVTITVMATDSGEATFARTFTINLRPDNCPGVSNPDQADLDHDGIGDLCDPTPVPGLAADQVNANLTGFASGSVKVRVTVTYTPRADGQCYLAHPASQASLAVRGASVDQTPESGPIVYSADGLLTVCLTPVTSSAEIDLTQWVTSSSGAVDINYVTIGRKDPELHPDGTCPSGSDCFESIFQGDVPAGSVTFTLGNQVAIKSFVTLHTTDLGQGPSTKVAVAPKVHVKVFDRDSPAFQAFDGSNPDAAFFDNIYESNAGRVGECVTDLSGNCLASVSAPDSYFVILKFVDEQNGKLVYEGANVGAGNFDSTTGLATKAFQVQKVLRNGAFVEYHVDAKILVVDCAGPACQ